MKVVTERMKEDGRFIAAVDASEYGLDVSGNTDCTEALQRAVDDCRKAGGGTVYLPAGHYALYGMLVIHTSVMLHGDGDDTVICCYYNRGTEEGMQIAMKACSGLIGVCLYHPDQDIRNPVPYPPAVRQQGTDSITIERVTFVNPWIAIVCGPDGNELHFIRKVRMSPLKQGIFMDMTTDIGRMQELSVSPVWYERFLTAERRRNPACLGTIQGQNEELVRDVVRMLKEYMFAHATGIHMARSDWEYGYDIRIECCKIGILITSEQDIGPNAQLSQVQIIGCETGIQLHCGNPYGIALTNAWISSGGRRRKTAIQSDETFRTVFQGCNVRVEGEYEQLVYHQGSGQLSFFDCSFAGKGVSEDILQHAGGLSILNSEFTSGGTQLRMLDSSGGTQMVGCRLMDQEEKMPVIVTEGVSSEVLLVEPGRLPIPSQRNLGHVPYPYSVRPENDALYVVTDYGAKGDGTADDTEAFREALRQAGITGGYVYIPGGMYRITEPLRVPAGVELRGTAEVPCHTMGGGSVLMVCCGHGDEEGEPFLSLSGSCGIRGIVLYHPGQDPVEPVPYPWTVRALGDRCYGVDTVFVNAWKGFDLGSVESRDHYVSYVSGAPIRCGIFAGKNSGGVWIENVQYNPHYWYRCDLPNRPKSDTWKAFWHNQIRCLEAFLYGENAELHVLNTFVFAAKYGVRFFLQDGKGSHGTMIGHGTDGGECGIFLEGAGQLELVNTELVTIESPNRRIYLRSALEKGDAVFYNTLMWGAPDTAVSLERGGLTMVLTNIVDSGDTAFVIEGGTANIGGTYLYRKEGQILVKGGRVRYIANMTVKQPDAARLGQPETAADKGELKLICNWYK